MTTHVPSVRRDALLSLSAIVNFIQANEAKATTLTPEIASMPVNWKKDNDSFQ